MNTQDILSKLREQRSQIDQAIAALEGSSGRGGSARMGAESRNGRRGPRHLSADARRRISLAQKRRWAERKKNA